MIHQKKHKIRTTIQWLLFVIGGLCLIAVLFIHDPVWALICLCTGLVCELVFWILAFASDRKAKTHIPKPTKEYSWIPVLENTAAVCFVSFYLMLAVMKILIGFDVSIPDWIGIVWLSLMCGGVFSVFAKENMVKRLTAKNLPVTQVSAVSSNATRKRTNSVIQEAPKTEHPQSAADQNQPKEIQKEEGVQMPKLPSLRLAGDGEPSPGEARLFDLTLKQDENGKPAVQWTVTWRGGYSHADSTYGIVPIPAEILLERNPAQLIAWIQKDVPQINDLVDWEAVKQMDTPISGWMAQAEEALSNEEKAEAMQKILGQYCPENLQFAVQWKGGEYRLTFPKGKGPDWKVQHTDIRVFEQYAMLYLARLRPKGLTEVSREFQPLDQNHWASRAEHGDELLYLEKSDKFEYLLWYISREFDTQNIPKLIRESVKYQVISFFTQKEYTAEEYLETTCIKEKWSSWAFESLSSDDRFCRIFRSPNKPFFTDYPVPFKKLIVYPGRIPYTTKNPWYTLEDRSSVSFGTKYHTRVLLTRDDSSDMLILESSSQSEHGSEHDQEFMIKAWLSGRVKTVHFLPLLAWIKSVPCNTERYVKSILVEVNPKEPPQIGRTRGIESYQNTVGHDLIGWNCDGSEIFLSFQSGNNWTLYRNAYWRESPSGLPYNVRIQMELTPDGAYNSDEVLCKTIRVLPWGDPDAADRHMQHLRNWLDAEYLCSQAEFCGSMLQANPMSPYQSKLDDVLKQLEQLQAASVKEQDSAMVPNLSP